LSLFRNIKATYYFSTVVFAPQACTCHRRPLTKHLWVRQHRKNYLTCRGQKLKSIAGKQSQTSALSDGRWPNHTTLQHIAFRATGPKQAEHWEPHSRHTWNDPVATIRPWTTLPVGAPGQSDNMNREPPIANRRAQHGGLETVRP